MKCHSSQTNCSEGSAENWRMDGLINLEKAFSSLKELGFNPVSYSAKTNYVQILQNRDTLIVQSP